MQAITVSDREAGVAGMKLTDLPYPRGVRKRCHRAGTYRGFHTRGT